MTILQPPRGAAGDAVIEDVTRSGRTIAVGVRDNLRDAATLTWAMHEARADIDVLRLLHAYVAMRPNAPTVAPRPGPANSPFAAGNQVLTDAARTVSRAHPDLRTKQFAIAGLPEEVLVEQSAIVELLVIGDDSANIEETRKITRLIQTRAGCPVVSVPTGYRPGSDRSAVTVIAGDRGLSDSAIRFGADMAIRHRATLQVSRTWESLHEGEQQGPTWIAHQQENLDGQLAGWRARYPHLAVVARLELGSGWLGRLRSMSALVITDQASASIVRTANSALPELCPTVAVSETW